jgi:hypothetical protein
MPGSPVAEGGVPAGIGLTQEKEGHVVPDCPRAPTGVGQNILPQTLLDPPCVPLQQWFR